MFFIFLDRSDIFWKSEQREPVHAFKLQYYILYLGQGIQRVFTESEDSSGVKYKELVEKEGYF